MSEKEQKAAADEGTPGIKEDVEIDDPHAVKVARTLLLIASWVCMGLYSEITGPTLQNLMDRVSSNYEEISRTLVARSVGFFGGSLLAGIICQRWSRLVDVWIGLALVLAALATACAPFSRSLAVLGTFFCLDGVAKGVLAVGASSYVIVLWKDKAAMPTQALHFAFGIGALTVPQICRPFLPPDDEALTTASPSLTTVATVKQLNFDIEIPYLIVSVILLAVAMAFAPMFLCFRPRVYITPPPGESCGNSFLNMIRPESCYTGSRALGVPFIVLTLVWFALPVGAERAYGKFIFSFSRDEAGFGASAAASLETVFWACFTGGRGVATLLSSWLSPVTLLTVELGVHLLSTTLLSALSGPGGHTAVLWAGTGLFGACMAPLFPTGITWANTVMDMTAVLTSFSFIATACGSFAFSWISGALFQYYGPMSLMYFMSAYAILATILYVILYLMSKKMAASEHSYTVEDVKLEKTADGLFIMNSSDSPSLKT